MHPDEVGAFAAKLDQRYVKRTRTGLTARCPAHDDRQQSLSVKKGNGGKLLLHCFAGCTFPDILAAAGLQRSLRKSAPSIAAVPSRPGIVAEYDYTDVNGTLLCQTVRLEPKDFRVRVPKPGGGWAWKLNGTRRVLYRLPLVIEAAAQGGRIYVVEGEKDADRLHTFGLVATTNLGGAAQPWLTEYTEALRGGSVVVLPDNDPAGEAHGTKIARALSDSRIEVRVCRLPGLPLKGDVSDWLAIGHTTAELEAIAEASPTWQPGDTPPPVHPSPDLESARPRPFPTVRVLEGDAPAPPAVHVTDLVLDRELNLWLGHGASAKSVLLMTTAVCVVLGRPVFGTLAVHRAGPVLLVLPEDGERAARMVFDAIIAGMELSSNDRAALRDGLVMISDYAVVNITTDARRIGQTALDVGAVLVALDPLRNLLGDAAENDNDVAGKCCDTLRRELCRGPDVTVVLNHHNRKPGKEAGPDAAPTVHDARGAGGWVNGSRLVFGVFKKDDRITLTGLKANRLRADLRHELTLSITADPANAARWLSCRVNDANNGASSDMLTAGIGRSLNANEQAALVCLDDSREEGKRLAWSRWRDDSGLKGDTFRSIKDRLITAGIVDVISTGRRARNGSPEHAYAITAAGKAALNSGWVHAPKL